MYSFYRTFHRTSFYDFPREVYEVEICIRALTTLAQNSIFGSFILNFLLVQDE